MGNEVESNKKKIVNHLVDKEKLNEGQCAVRGMASSRVPFYSPAKPGGGGYTKPIGFYSKLVLDSKKAFSIFGPLREKLGKRLLYPVGSFFP